MSPHADAARRQVPRARRLDEVVDAASRVFAARGYRRTQMADVADALGSSPGNLYNYVPGKETLFALVLRRTIDGPLAQTAVELPVAPLTLAEGVRWLRRRLDFVSDFPVMEAALTAERVEDPQTEAREIVLELHAVVERVAPLILVIERSLPELPELAAAFGDVRQELFSRMARYVEARVSIGTMRPLEAPAVSARLVVELVVWSALRRPQGLDPSPIPAETAREAVADLAVHALVPDRS